MSKSFIKKTLVAGALSLALSFQLVAPASAATNEVILAAAKKGIDYLGTNQTANGGVAGFSDVTDWAVIAVAANGQEQETLNNGGVSALDYLLAHPLTSASLATDVEKRILAIAAAGEDTSDFGDVDYHDLLATYHNNDQIGDPTLLNDDMFGLIAAHATKDGDLEDMAQDALDYLIANQEADGGFSYTTDSCAYCGSDSNDTAAALMAFAAADAMDLDNDDLDEAKEKAIAYLLSTKQTDGGFSYDIYSPSDGSSTAWALMALNTLGEDVATEANAARDWLLANQNADGGFSFGAYGYTESDVSTTTHAVIAIMGTSWLLQPAPIQQPTTPPVTETPPTTPTPAPTTTTTSTTTTTTQTSSPPPVVTVVRTTYVPTEPTAVLSDTTPQIDESAETTQTPTPTPETPATPAKKTNFTWWFAGALILVAIIWYVLQSRSKLEKK